MKIKLLLILNFFFICNHLIGQINITESNVMPKNTSNVYAGIEISTKAVKISVLQLLNANKGEYNVISSWNENTNVGSGISVNKIICEEDIDKTAQIVQKSFQKLTKELQINQERIFIVISSGVGTAKNVKELSDFIQTLTQKKVSIINILEESKFLIKGSIPIKNIDDAMVFDIGGGNSKGGFVTKNDDLTYTFTSIGINYGTVSLTDKIKSKFKKNQNLFNYLSEYESYTDSIKNLISELSEKNKILQTKNNIYLSGGAVWAFISIYKKKSTEKFIEFNLQDVRNYNLDLLTSFKKIEKKSLKDKEIETVLNTYSQMYLISGTNILISFLENIDNLEKKKIYFVNNGYVTWLKSYIIDTVNSKVKY